MKICSQTALSSDLAQQSVWSSPREAHREGHCRQETRPLTTVAEDASLSFTVATQSHAPNAEQGHRLLLPHPNLFADNCNPSIFSSIFVFFHFLISLFWFGLVSQIPSTHELWFLVIHLYLKVRH